MGVRQRGFLRLDQILEELVDGEAEAYEGNRSSDPGHQRSIVCEKSTPEGQVRVRSHERSIGLQNFHRASGQIRISEQVLSPPVLLMVFAFYAKQLRRNSRAPLAGWSGD